MRATQFLSELSTELLARYKKAAYADAKKADAEGDYERGNKRFKGINKATIKQFDNDAKERKLDEKSTTEKQARFMAAAAHDPQFAARAGIKQSVAKEFNKADTGTKQLSNAMKHKPKKKKVSEGADLSAFGDDYLRKAADPNRFGRYMVSIEDAQAELAARAQGKQQTVPAPAPAKPQGFSREYLQKVINGELPRPLISVERAQELLANMQEGMFDSKPKVDFKARAKELFAKGLTEQQVLQQLTKEGCPPNQAAVFVQGAQLESIAEWLAEEGKASRALCQGGKPDSELGASQLASCKSQGLRARDGEKSHLIGHAGSKVRIKVGGKKIKGKKYGGPLPDYGTRKSQL